MSLGNPVRVCMYVHGMVYCGCDFCWQAVNAETEKPGYEKDVFFVVLLLGNC